VPIYQTSTFAFESTNAGRGAVRGRPRTATSTPASATPRSRALEDCVAEARGRLPRPRHRLRHGRRLTLGLPRHCSARDATSSPRSSVYGPSRTVLEHACSPASASTSTFVAHRDGPGEIEAAIRPETRLVYVETPTNPTVEITDLARAAEIGPRRTTPSSASTTPSAAPCLQRPLEHGCRHRPPQHDEVPERPRRRRRRASSWRRNEADVREAPPRGRDQRRRHDRPPPGLARAPGNQDPAPARRPGSQQNATALATHARGAPDKVRVGSLPRPRRATPPASWLERQMDGPGALHLLRAPGRLRGRPARSSTRVRLMIAGRQPGRHRDPHPASRLDDARRHVEARPARSAGITDGLVRLSVGCEDLDDLQRGPRAGPRSGSDPPPFPPESGHRAVFPVRWLPCSPPGRYL
jgi:hypothetical protein